MTETELDEIRWLIEKYEERWDNLENMPKHLILGAARELLNEVDALRKEQSIETL